MKQIALLGLSTFGISCAEELYHLGQEVLVIDNKEEKVQDIITRCSSIRAMIADATSRNTLESIGVANFDIVISAVGNDQPANIILPMLLKELGCKKVIAKATNTLEGKVLRKVGADIVVYPERDMGKRVAHNLVNDVLEHIKLSENSSIQEILVPKKIIGKTLLELDLRKNFNLNVLAIKRNSKIEIELKPEDKFQKEDIVLIMGKNENIDKLKKYK